jgi:uncharacterized LabA/DUF88 family protein
MSKNTTNRQDLTSSLKKAILKKKVLVLIDGANLYYSAYAKHLNIDFGQMYGWFKKNSELIDIIYYTAYDPEDTKQLTFIENLSIIGYKINKKPVKTFNDETKKGNLDVELTVDAVTNIANYDILILISGDGDFTYLVQTVDNFEKKVIILGIGGFMSFELHQEADNYFFLDRIKSVWQTPKVSKVKEKKEPHSNFFLNLDIFGIFKDKIPDAHNSEITKIVENVISKERPVIHLDQDYPLTPNQKAIQKQKPKEESKPDLSFEKAKPANNKKKPLIESSNKVKQQTQSKPAEVTKAPAKPQQPRRKSKPDNNSPKIFLG